MRHVSEASVLASYKISKGFRIGWNLWHDSSNFKERDQLLEGYY
jgi:hypothetical protein